VGYANIRRLQPGDRLLLNGEHERIVRRVSAYADFAELVAHEDPQAIAPELPPADLLATLRELYPPAKEALGAFALELQPPGRRYDAILFDMGFTLVYFEPPQTRIIQEALRSAGVEGLQARVRRDVGNAAWLADQVVAAPEWGLMAPAPLQTVCLRHQPAALAGDEKALARHNAAIVERVTAAGHYYFGTSLVKGRLIIRISVGAQATEREHVAGAWAALQEAAGA
jgi:ASC-1-like (ASCH) protein